jgi:TonB-dependent receptor
VCGNGGLDLVLRQITCSPSSLFGPTAVYGFRATPALSELVTLGNAGQPEGNTNSWLIPNIDAAADYTGLYNRPLLLDAGNNRSVTEQVKGGYFQVDLDGSVLGINVRANAGMRYVRTEQSSTGLNSGTQVTVDRDYEDWLPSANIAADLTPNLVLRAAVAKVMTRPLLANLTPGGSADGFNFRVNFGNPDLQPYRATAYDAALEWYFAPQSVFSVAFFKKEIDSFPVASSRVDTFTSTGLPTSVLASSSPGFLNPALQAQPIWTIQTTVNGTGADLKGVEISLQAPFRFLPGFLSNFGGIVNASFIDSNATYAQGVPATVPGGGNVNQLFTTTLYQLSRRAFNATLYYEDSRFSARASVAYRGGFNDQGSAGGNVFEGYNSITNVDASIRYKITDNVELSLEGTNLTDAYRDRWVDQDANRIYENNHFGRTFLVGARFKM